MGTVPVGKIEAGRIRAGMVIDIAPHGLRAEVVSLEMHNQAIEEANAGDKIGLNLGRNIPFQDIKRGYVASDPKNDPAKETSMFVAQMVVLNHPGKIHPGYTPVIDCHTSHIACRFQKLISIIEKIKCEVVIEDPIYIS